MQTGLIIPWASDIAPAGYLLCDGRQLNKNDFPNLFNVIQYTYSNEKSGNMFNIPDIRSRCIVGSPNTGMLGVKVGEETHELSVNELPSHNHGGGNHIHRYDISGAGQSNGFALGANATNFTVPDSFYNRSFQSSGNIFKTNGNNTPHQNMQPYTPLYYYIKY